VDGAESERHRGDARQRAGGHRQQSQAQGERGPINRQQNGDHENALMADSRIAARLILARAATAKTPGPLIFNCTAEELDGSVSATPAPKAPRIACKSRSWASVSEPGAAVCATSRVRAPSAETQTPCCVRGLLVRDS